MDRISDSPRNVGPSAVEREFDSAAEGTGKVPGALWVFAGLVGCLASFYFGVYHGGFRSDVFDENDSSARLLSKFDQVDKSKSAVTQVVSLAEEGKKVYSNCVACHQGSGLGVPNQFPPLVGASWVTGSEKRLVSILLKGLVGVVDVNGVSYNGVMPAWEKQLSDRKIAAVATYVRSAWGNSAGEISEEKVRALRMSLADRSASWTQSELMEITEGQTIEVGDHGAGARRISSSGGGVQATSDAAVDLESGKALYGAICAACHQPSGLGLPPVFPPLSGSEYILGNSDRIVAIILKGLQGPINVGGVAFNGVMPAQEGVLSDKKISEIVSYVRKSFGNAGLPLVTSDEVSKVRSALSSRSVPWTEAELTKFPSQGLPDSNP